MCLRSNKTLLTKQAGWDFACTPYFRDTENPKEEKRFANARSVLVSVTLMYSTHMSTFVWGNAYLCQCGFDTSAHREIKSLRCAGHGLCRPVLCHRDVKAPAPGLPQGELYIASEIPTASLSLLLASAL